METGENCTSLEGHGLPSEGCQGACSALASRTDQNSWDLEPGQGLETLSASVVLACRKVGWGPLGTGRLAAGTSRPQESPGGRKQVPGRRLASGPEGDAPRA